MPRIVAPEWLTLRLGSLPASGARYQQVEQKYGPLLRERAHDTREPGVPVSLRWTVNPLLGFPRQPFEVWRRTRKEEPASQILGTASRAAPATIALQVAVIEIRFDAAPGAGGLTVEALGQSGAVLPGQRLAISAPGGARFRAAGIAGLRLSGAGAISNVGALVQSDWANLKDWVRIEVVGFPFDIGKLPVAAYDPGLQGWEVPAMPGPDAAQLRLGVAQLLQPDSPPPGGGLTAPSWPFPDPAAFLGAMSSLGTLDDIADCLASSDDTDAARLQSDHAVSRSLPGLRQPGQAPGAAGDPATLALRTTSYVALAVQDAPVALGLGFGTIDVPPAGQFGAKPDAMPPGTELGRDEYLVTASFVTPWGAFDIAAIGHREPAPPALAGVIATATFGNRAAARNAPESAAISLSWSLPLLPAGAGVLARPPGAPTALFNTPRPAGSGGFQPYLTEYRIADDGFPPADLRPSVTMPEEIAPVSGSATTSYGVAPLDVHGRWGPWAVRTHVLSARPVQPPGIGAVSLDLPAVLPATGPVAAGCTLTAEVSWDWADRSPDRIELSGAFVPVGPPPPSSVIGFQPVSTQASTPLPLTIGFSLAGTPSIVVPPPGSPPAAITVAQNAAVTEIEQQGVPAGPPPAGAAGSQVRRYRISVSVMSVSFATAGVLEFAVSARAAERVRPAELSKPTDPRATSIANPFPAPPPTLPPVTVLWTALPDAAGRARTVLSWPAVPGASGYFVWEATETALSVAVGGTPAGGAIRARAANLKARVAASQQASLGAFSRLNETALAGTSIELELPGSADTLFAYRVASITGQNVESARSADIVLVGVPHRDAPGTPALDAVPAAGVLLTVVPGAGAAPAGLRLHRVRREFLAAQIGTMGPAVLTTATAVLTPVTVPSLSGPPRAGWQFTDPAEASWTPYYYRCVTTGQHAPDDGVLAGDSPPSGVTSVLVAPPLAPLLTVAPALSGPAGVLVRLHTDLPVTPTPAGTASLRIAAVAPPSAGGTGTGAAAARTVLAAIDPATVPPRAALTTSGAPVSDVEATRQAGLSGGSDVTVLLPAGLVPAGASLVVTAVDPLGRATSAETG